MKKRTKKLKFYEVCVAKVYHAPMQLTIKAKNMNDAKKKALKECKGYPDSYFIEPSEASINPYVIQYSYKTTDPDKE